MDTIREPAARFGAFATCTTIPSDAAGRKRPQVDNDGMDLAMPKAERKSDLPREITGQNQVFPRRGTISKNAACAHLFLEIGKHQAHPAAR